MINREYKKIIEDIAKKVWSIMPKKAHKYVIKYEINEDIGQRKSYWEDSFKNKGNMSLNEYPSDILDDIGHLLKELKSHMNNQWNHCCFILFDNMEFNINFSSVSEEDSWPGLFMKGVSDLSYDEIANFHIPLEYWEERVRIKNSKS